MSNFRKKLQKAKVVKYEEECVRDIPSEELAAILKKRKLKNMQKSVFFNKRSKSVKIIQIVNSKKVAKKYKKHLKKSITAKFESILKKSTMKALKLTRR